ncbi:hypothetical protein IWQ62_006102, partial [Dispira parvispora]
TKCGHYFCEKCALTRFKKTPKCYACNAPTGGLFNTATALLKKQGAQAKRARKSPSDDQVVIEGLDQGDYYLAEAQKHTRSGWFRKPEWDIAGQMYEKAANSFKASREPNKAIAAYEKAAEAMSKFGSIYLAAKSIENAASLAQQSHDTRRAVELFTKASDLYVAYGSSPDRAATMLEHAAEQCESLDPDRAIELYRQGCAIYESEERYRMAIDPIKRAVGCAVRHQRFPMALDFLTQLAKATQVLIRRSELDKACLSKVIVLLAMDDIVEARKQLDEWSLSDPSQARSEWAPSSGINPERSLGDMSQEAQVAQTLVDAFEQWDAEKLQEALTTPKHAQTLQFLVPDVARLTRSFRLPGAPPASQPQYHGNHPGLPPSSSLNNPTPGQGTPGSYPLEEEEDEHGLC